MSRLFRFRIKQYRIYRAFVPAPGYFLKNIHIRNHHRRGLIAIGAINSMKIDEVLILLLIKYVLFFDLFHAIQFIIGSAPA